MTGWYCPKCGCEMFYHIDCDAIICENCGQMYAALDL